jgi:sulfate permease, SulP family
VAAFAGLVLGLFLVAARSARIPVRHVWTGSQLSSNCARGSGELRILAQHGAQLRVFELEGDMFFALGASLDRSLHASSEGASCVVLDWSRVRHIDTSVAAVVAAFERHEEELGVLVVHAGAAGMPHGNVAEELRRHIAGVHLAADLDYALELAENHLILEHQHERAGEVSSVFEAMQLFDGMSVEERTALEQAMTQKLFPAGEVILRAGDESHEMMLILQGSASIVVANQQGQPVRLAGARRGALIGEIAFLDGSTRSASVLAQSDVVVASLDRARFEQLCRVGDPVVPKLLSNIAVALARRLRHTNHLALARSRTH